MTGRDGTAAWGLLACATRPLPRVQEYAGAGEVLRDELGALHACLSDVDALGLVVTAGAAHDLGVAGAERRGPASARRDRRPHRAATTHPVADVAFAVQRDLGERPCVDAWSSDLRVLGRRGGFAVRWPEYAPKAAHHGIELQYAVPLHDDGRRTGMLTFLALSGPAAAIADPSLLDAAAAVLAVRLAALLREGQARRALASRTVISRAAGVLRERYGLDEHAALAYLRRRASAAEVPVHEVAAPTASQTPAADCVSAMRTSSWICGCRAGSASTATTTCWSAWSSTCSTTPPSSRTAAGLCSSTSTRSRQGAGSP